MSLQQEFDLRKKQGLFRQRRIIDSAQGSLVKIDGKEFINFSSNDYLGLANNEQLKTSMIEAVSRYGIGAGSSQLLAGCMTPHKMLEDKLATFLNREATLVFSTGYQANLAIASALINSNTVVLQDKLNHASLIDAALLSKGKLVRYRHNDLEHLKTLLKKHRQHELMVMTDGVFSMEGDFARLIEITELCKKYNALLIVDDAHGIGVLGSTGAGLLEELNLNQQQVPLLVGTFGKSFGASGAFVSGSKIHIEAFIQKARTYIYTTAMLPAVAATLVQAIDLISTRNDLRDHIKSLVAYYKAQINGVGLNHGESSSHIQSLIIGEAEKTLAINKALYEKNVLVSAIRPPTVPKNTSRLRISITATHTKNQVKKLTDLLRMNSEPV